MYKVHPKHHQHIFSPLSMLYNYFNQTKQSINGFFTQYLKQQGRQKLLLFNRYMILIVLLNVDIKFLLLISLIAFIIVKLIKLKPWINKHKCTQQLPVSYIQKLKHIQKQLLHKQSSSIIKRYKSEQKSQNSKNHNHESINNSIVTSQQKQNLYSSLQDNSINSIKQNSILKQSKLIDNEKNNSINDLSSTILTDNNDLKSTIVTNIQPNTIQQQIYSLINKLIKMYCKFVWYAKAKSIIFLWVSLIIIYFFQPNLQNDTYHIITSTNQGVLQIDSIKKASQYVNYFQLIFIWIIINLILFYQYGTKQLKHQLLQQLYTKQYTYNLIKQKKLKINRLYSKVNQSLIKTQQTNHQQASFSQKKYHTFILKKKQTIDIQQLKDFSHSKHHDDSQFTNPRKLSHDDLVSPLSHKQKKTSSKILIDFVESQQQQSEKDEKNLNESKKSQVQQKQTQSVKNTIPSSKIAVHQTTQKKKILQRKNSFLPASTQQSKFKISLLKVQASQERLDNKQA